MNFSAKLHSTILRSALPLALAFGLCTAGAHAQAPGVTNGAVTGAAPAANSAASPSAQANNAALLAVTNAIRKNYPAMRFDSITTSEIPGLYEIVMGKQVAYVEGTGRYFLFGHLFDMPVQQDLTAARLEGLNRVEFSQLPLADAIKTVRGDGSRVVAIFSDPDCPYCRQLEQSLISLNNVTIYTFLYPLAQLHPQARDKAIAIWCAKNRSAAWENQMLRGHGPAGTPPTCPNPVDRTIALGGKLGIQGTPMIIAADGRQLPGAVPADKLEQWLALTPKVSGTTPTTKTAAAGVKP